MRFDKYILLKTVFEGDNFGSSLQAFALKNYIEENFNTQCIVITRQEIGVKAKCQRLKSKVVNFFKSFLNAKLFINTWSSHLNKNIKTDRYSEKIREQFRSFTEKYISPSCFCKSELKKLSADNKCLRCVVGSDQVWNPTLTQLNETNFLRFSPKEKNISYSASIGASEIPYFNYFPFKKYIRNIKYISVREETAKELLNDKFAIEATVCVDPTVLAGKDFWISNSEPIKTSEPYIFCYFLNKPSKQAMDFIDKKIDEDQRVLVLSRKDFSKYNLDVEVIDDISPLEFPSYILNSECVLTDSFHGMIFSLLLNKNFFVFERDYENYIPQSSRIVDLLDELLLSNRYISRNDTVCETDIDYEMANQVMENKRKKSITFLKEAIDA